MILLYFPFYIDEQLCDAMVVALYVMCGHFCENFDFGHVCDCLIFKRMLCLYKIKFNFLSDVPLLPFFFLFLNRTEIITEMKSVMLATIISGNLLILVFMELYIIVVCGNHN